MLTRAVLRLGSPVAAFGSLLLDQAASVDATRTQQFLLKTSRPAQQNKLLTSGTPPTALLKTNRARRARGYATDLL
jgi:hypothetical protein